MKVKLDRQADVLIIRFSDEKVQDTAVVKPGVILDYDAAGRIVALQILNASETLSGSAADGLAVEVN